MRVKAFTLIEMIITIILLVMLFSLSFTNIKQNFGQNSIQKLQDILSSFKNQSPNGKTTLYIYGNNCENAKIFKNKKYIKSINIPELGKFTTIKRDIKGNLSTTIYKTITIDKEKLSDICLDLVILNGNFLDKTILKIKSRYILLDPMHQAISRYSTMDIAKRKFFCYDKVPKSLDDLYFH